MRLYKYLTELFQEKKDWKIRTKEKEDFTAVFEVSRKKGYVTVEYMPDSIPQYTFGELTFEDEYGRVEVTKMERESAIEIFSYIISITKYFLKEYEPHIVKFGGFELKQQKLYEKIVSRYKKEIEKLGYKVEDRKKFEDIIIKRKE